MYEVRQNDRELSVKNVETAELCMKFGRIRTNKKY